MSISFVLCRLISRIQWLFLLNKFTHKVILKETKEAQVGTSENIKNTLLYTNMKDSLTKLIFTPICNMQCLKNELIEHRWVPH